MREIEEREKNEAIREGREVVKEVGRERRQVKKEGRSRGREAAGM